MPTQADRILHLQSPLGETRCAINALTGRERLNALYEFDLTLVADQDPVKPDELLGEDIKATIKHAGIERTVHGVVREFVEISPAGDNVFEYIIQVVPRLWLLSLSSHNRLFEQKNVVDIVKQVVNEGCQMSIETANLKTYRTREICCQYGETDLQFVTRLLAEEGIAYYFKHTPGDCKLVLCGGMEGFPNTDPASYPYNERDNSPWKQRVSSFKQQGRLCSGKLNSVDYGEYAPSSPLEVKAESKIKPKKLRPGEITVFGHHDFEDRGAGRNLPRADCTEQAKRWLHGLEADGDEFNGDSGAPSFIAGYKIELEDIPVSSGGEKRFLLTEVIHSAVEGLDREAHYSNNFTCVASSNSMAFTPRPPAERPRVWGVHTAKVIEIVSPQDSHVDIRVQFPWESEQSSCWARVAQLYAGNAWGSFFIPDVDQEVLVEFINGDPDRPVVVGAVYNENNPKPPYDNLVQSGIRTRSGDYNELRFDDTAGAEEFYFEAGKDHNFLVKNDEKGEILNDQSLKVVNNQSIDVGAEQDLKVGANQKVDVASNVDYEAGGKIKIKAGTQIEVEAGVSITLKVGGSEVKIDNTGVTIDGAMIGIKGNVTTEMSGSAMLTLKGGLVKIN